MDVEVAMAHPAHANRRGNYYGGDEGEQTLISASMYQLSDGHWRFSISREYVMKNPPLNFLIEGDTMELERLIQDINEEGYHVSNLFQTRDRSWQANLRTANGSLQQTYGHGSTPYLALLEARTKFAEPKAPKVVGLGPASTGADLLTSLGLRKRELAR